MLVVITIIGFMAALALPHLPGMTKANSMTTALQQLQNDCSLARQLAMLRRTPVYMVFVPPNFSANSPNGPLVNEQNNFSNLLTRQYSAYALVSLRSVGDQPGQSFPQYLTEWKPLPDGVFVAPWKFSSPATVYSTNTLTDVVNTFNILPFPTNIFNFPFPAADALGTTGPFFMALPYIGFSPLGRLTTFEDEYIPLDSGNIFFPPGAASATPIEVPVGNAINNPNIIHIDAWTARAKIERNQLR